MKKFKVKAKLEISDHDGWCSDNECNYNSFIKKYIIYAPADYKYNNKNDLITLLPVPDINYGSDYCDLNNNCKKNNLERHEYKYTILKVCYNVEL